ncbi:uncharacterized protein LOC142240140 [Haematobia irritans]|uniref:Uncharacterized protein n=1 Tax=Haematobia irritans TaxID=7368 RepID=A0A1L8EFQ2_HAEIR
MAGDILTRQSVIIGAFSTAISGICLLKESLDLWDIWEWKESEDLEDRYGNLAIYTTFLLFSILLVWGAHKRRHLLMTPWMICGFGLVALYIFALACNFNHLPMVRVETLAIYLATIGAQILILYTLCCQFCKIKNERSEDQKAKRNNYHKI